MFDSTLIASCLLSGLITRSAAAAINGRSYVNSGKGVYAHFMVGNAYSATVDTWVSNIQLAQAGGIDGFALNVGPLDWEPARVSDAYTAASNLGTGFKLFISLDMAELPCASSDDATRIRSYINTYAGHPNQLWYQDRLILSSFSGQNCLFGQGNFNDGWNYAIRNGVSAKIGFIPALFVDPSTFKDINMMDGIFQWNAGWPMDGSDISWTDQNWIDQVGQRYYIAPVSPLFFTHYSPATYNKNWLFRSDDWLYANRWEELIAHRDSVDFVEIITWNDYGESHYIGPIGPDQPNSQNWVNGFDHQAYLAVTKYYSAAWKTGSYPAITQNQIFLTARPHSKNAACTSDSVAQPSYVERTDDSLYALIFAKDAGSLNLSIGNSCGSFRISPGVNKIKLPLDVGSPHAVLYDSTGNIVVDFAPPNFSYTGNSCSTYNFNYYTAMSS